MAVTMVGASQVRPCRYELKVTLQAVPVDEPVCRKGDVDCLKLQPAPRFSPLHPIAWLEHKAATVAEPLKMDAKVLVTGVVAAPAVGAGVKVLSIVQEGVKISKAGGLRAFAAQAGWKGSFRAVATAYGKASLRSFAAEGLVVLGAAATAAIVWRAQHAQAKRTAQAAGPCQ
jgi:hypothetical protein